MLILEEPFASSQLISWAIETKHPVLKNQFSKQLVNKGHKLELVDDNEAAAKIDADERVYTNSENALDWLLENTHQDDILHPIRLFKDKAATRRELASLSPTFFYREFTHDELNSLDIADLNLPVVLKPSIGFCSMGVYTISDEQDWKDALSDIESSNRIWASRYPESVISSNSFVVEQFIDGPEYAIDMFYDENGKAQILNIMHHVFASHSDTSDRLYNTSSKIIDDMLANFEEWLNAANNIVRARNFPAHVEIRVAPDGTIIPIEFNPMRFAGLGGTDLANYAWGVRTYAAFLENSKIDLAQLAHTQEDKVFTMSLLNPHPTADLSKPFQYEKLMTRFSKVLDLHRFDVNAVGSYGFLFLETDASSASELDWLLNSDLLEFA